MTAIAGANLVEIFSSFQGEGPHIGERTLFVRFGECDLRCAWCDSQNTWLPARSCRIERCAGEGDVFDTIPNPVSIERIVEAARALGGAENRYASLTGGEPLLQPEAVRATALALRGEGLRIHLETHGLAVAALERVLPTIDAVSMDWKFSSAVRRATTPRGERDRFDDEHEAFARVASGAPELVVKCVVTSETEDAEIDSAIERIARSAPEATVVLQPVTPTGRGEVSPGSRQLQRWQRRALERHASVRIIPQTHPALGAL